MTKSTKNTLIYTAFIAAAWALFIGFMFAEAQKRGAEAATLGDLVAVSRVYDGDTFFIDYEGVPEVFGKNLGVRIRGIDTPEIHGKCEYEKQLAVVAKQVLTDTLAGAQQVTLHNMERDKYFRVLADVKADGASVAVKLVNMNLARPYSGGKKESWCK